MSFWGLVLLAILMLSNLSSKDFTDGMNYISINMEQRDVENAPDPVVVMIINKTYLMTLGNKTANKVNQLIEKNPEDGLLLTCRGIIHDFYRRHDDSYADYQKALLYLDDSEYLNEYESLVHRAEIICRNRIFEILYNKGEYVQALEYAETLLRNPESTSVYDIDELRFNVAICYDQIGRKEEALEFYQTIVLNGYPKFEGNYFIYQDSARGAAKILHPHRQEEISLNQQNTWIEDDPADYLARLNRAILFNNADIPELALADGEIALAGIMKSKSTFFPQQAMQAEFRTWYDVFANAKLLVATNYQKQGKYELAMKGYQELLAYGRALPSYARIYSMFNTARIYCTKQDTANAQKEFQSLLGNAEFVQSKDYRVQDLLQRALMLLQAVEDGTNQDEFERQMDYWDPVEPIPPI